MFRFFENLIDPFQPYDMQQQPSPHVWTYLFQNLKPLGPILLISMVLTAISTSIEIWLIGFGGQVVDMLASATPATLWQDHGIELGIAALVILVLRPLPAFAKEAMDDIAFKPNAVAMVRFRAHRHVLQQSVGWFRNDMAGRIASRVQYSGRGAMSVAYSVVHTLVSAGFYAAGSIWLLSSYDARLTLPLIGWVVIYLALMAYVVPRIAAASKAMQRTMAGMSGILNDTYGNIDTIKLFANAAEEDKASLAQFKDVRAATFRVQRLEVGVNAALLALGSVLIVALVGTSILLWQAGDAPLGLIAATLALSFRFVAMAEWLLDAVSSLFANHGALRDALGTVAQPIEIADAPDAKPLVVSGGGITLDKLTHSYGRELSALGGVSLSIAPGEKVGLVGRSGAGKSTLVNLILRFYEADSGRILIDGQDIRSVTQNSLRQHIAMVTQDAALLHRSVKENIAYGRPDADMAAITAAAARAEADQFIPDLRDQEGRSGYDAHVGERGVKLSGGQRQRIALARAILKDAPILILDEATSALDSEVEAAIQATLYKLMEGKTVIAIAHRLSTIAHMDRIVVLDEGQIAEQGSHQELLDQNGIYAALWARQSGGFLGVDVN